ncbi:MAG TPA: RnfABCDGE type electron transport complex subunit D [Anaerolineales bacterium]
MIRFIDNQLNKITMYRLALYILIFLLGAALLISIFGTLPYSPWSLLISVGFILGVSWATNRVFARTFGVPANVESVYISSLILALIITPIRSAGDLWFLGWAAVLAMASKYVLAPGGKHIFNPAAFAVAVTYLTINQTASWWVGSGPMLPYVLPAGLLLVRKLGRFDLVLSFLATALGITVLVGVYNGTNLISTLQKMLVYSPLLFFSFVILTEPLTTPPTRRSRILYGGIVGLLFAPQLHVGSVFLTPELAILIGNLYSFIVSPKSRMLLRLKERTRLSPDTYEFVFAAPSGLNFRPGQYMEWTLDHAHADDRGNRRYFTLASSPTEHNIRVAVKFNKESSTYKKAMLGWSRDTTILASQLAGEFTLPDDPQQKCILIAGGIGVTPFRSMIKYLLDRRERRPITLFYTAHTADEFLYRDVFDRARQELGIQTIYTLTDNRNVPSNWNGKVGRITPELIRSVVPDYRDAVFYVSGPRGLVDSFKDSIQRLGPNIPEIRTDYFAGLA